MHDLRPHLLAVVRARLPAADVERERRIQRAAEILGNSANRRSRVAAMSLMMREARDRSPEAVAAIARYLEAL